LRTSHWQSLFFISSEEITVPFLWWLHPIIHSDGLRARITLSNKSYRLRLRLFLLPTVSRPVRLDVGQPSGAHDQILIFLCLTVIFLLFHVGCPLWREDGPVICTAIPGS
jgi:hypothetical protein